MRLYSGQGMGSAGLRPLKKGLWMYLCHVPASTCAAGAALAPLGAWLLVSRARTRAAGVSLLGALSLYLVVSFHHSGLRREGWSP